MEHPVLGVIHDQEEVSLDIAPATSPVEEAKESTTPSSEEPKQPDVQKEVPFGEHPRFKELIEEKNSYKQQIDEMRAELEQFKLQVKPPEQQQQNSNVPEEFVELFGTSDPKAYELFKKVAGGGLDENTLAQKVNQMLEQKEKEQVEQEKLVKQYQEEYDTKVSSLADKHGFSKAQFRKWFAENPSYIPSKFDESGNPVDFDFDWERGAKLFALENPPKSRSSVSPPASPNGDVGDKPKFSSLKELADASWGRL
jgi:hypothetical protein